MPKERLASNVLDITEWTKKVRPAVKEFKKARYKTCVCGTENHYVSSVCKNPACKRELIKKNPFNDLVKWVVGRGKEHPLKKEKGPKNAYKRGISLYDRRFGLLIICEACGEEMPYVRVRCDFGMVFPEARRISERNLAI